MAVKILFRLEVKGERNIPHAGGFILASNHASYLDPVVLACACPRKLNFMARHDLFTIPVLGALISRIGAFPLRRNFADIASIKEALRRLQKAGGLLLFPEGSRSLDGLSQDVQSGIGFMAAKSQAPVVPAFIKGSQRAFGRNARFIKPTKIRVYLGKPIYPVRPMRPTEKIKERPNRVHPKNSNLEDNYGEFANKIMQEINRLNQMKGGI